MVAWNSEKEIPVGRRYTAINALVHKFITGLNPSTEKRSARKSWWEISSLHSLAKPNSQGTGYSTRSNWVQVSGAVVPFRCVSSLQHSQLEEFPLPTNLTPYSCPATCAPVTCPDKTVGGTPCTLDH